MTNLYLDNQRPAPAGWVLVRTAPMAIRAIATGRVSRVSLDHDLDPGDGSGMDVASWMESAAAAGTLRPVIWSVHSANPAGARRMRAALERMERHWLARGHRP